MTEKEINEIYDRLYNISPKMEARSIPNPRYISEKIGECHLCIEEVERFYIKTNKEYSILQRAYNNAEAAFAIAKDDLLTNDFDITSLPNQKDREARANNKLKDKVTEIKNLKNELDMLKILLDTINVKFKDLGRLNFDIKLQLRIMEAQIKLGTGGIETEKSLMDELKKTALGKDVWEGSDSQVTEETIMDPSKPIDPNALVWQNGVPVTQPEGDVFDELERLVEKEINNPSAQKEEIPAVSTEELVIDSTLNSTTTEPIIDLTLINTTTQPILDSTSSTFSFTEGADISKDFLGGNVINNPSEQVSDPVVPEPVVPVPVASIELNEPSEDEDEKNLFFPEDDDVFTDLASDNEESTEVETEIDLDKILEPFPNPIPISNPDSGGEPEVIIKEETKIKVESEPQKTQEPVKQNTNEISFADLLRQFN